MSDFLELWGKYGSLTIPVRCGQKAGEVHNLIMNSRSLESIKSYVRGVRETIELQKYYDSEGKGYDVGPTFAAINMMENGSYRKLVDGIMVEEGLRLDGCEQVLRVTEGGEVHHILPKNQSLMFHIHEQIGVMLYDVYKRIGNSISPEEIRKMKNEWAHMKSFEDKINGAIYREATDEAIKEAQIAVLESQGSPIILQNCVVYRNVCKKIMQKFHLEQHDIEKVSRLELAFLANPSNPQSSVSLA